MLQPTHLVAPSFFCIFTNLPRPPLSLSIHPLPVCDSTITSTPTKLLCYPSLVYHYLQLTATASLPVSRFYLALDLPQSMTIYIAVAALSKHAIERLTIPVVDKGQYSVFHRTFIFLALPCRLRLYKAAQIRRGKSSLGKRHQIFLSRVRSIQAYLASMLFVLHVHVNLHHR